MSGNQGRLSILVAFAIVTACFGAVRIPNIFGDNMVLQSNIEYGARAFLNGMADPNEQVEINVSPMGKKGGSTYNVAADADGKWKVMLNPTHPGGNYQITVKGENGPAWTAVNVTYGDVFLCSGQSNMVFPMSLTLNASEEIATAADFPQFRLFTVGLNTSSQEEFNVSGSWEPLTTKNLPQFSAVCYMAVREIAKLHAGNRPMGLIQSAWGGTRVEAWMSPKALKECTDKPLAGQNPQNTPSALWNAMIAPLTSVSVRSGLWYQGEANAEGGNSTEYYSCMFQSMIKQWRDRFGIGDFAYNFVQLPPSVPANTPPEKQHTGRPEVRAAQADSQPKIGGETDISGMAVTIDMGGSSAWGYDHPPNKNEIARRLGLVTLHTAYALQEQWNGSIRFTGPRAVDAVYESSENSIVINYEEFSAQDLQLVGVPNCTTCCNTSPFEVFDGKSWTSVNSSIQGNTVVIPGDKSTTQVRYAWIDFVQCVLINNDTLVSGPFWFNVTSPSTSSLKNVHVNVEKDQPIQSPPMGFNSWNFYHCNIDENIVREVGQAFIDRGLHAVGYQYVNIDDCWQVARDANGTIVPDPVRFPSGMARLASDIHAMGLKFGVYTARGSGTCQGRPGSLNHEVQDATTYCDWKLDYLKIDKCQGAQDDQTSWTRFHETFVQCYNDTGKFIVQSVESCDDPNNCGKWVGSVANLWRTGADIQATFSSVLHNIKVNDVMANVANPGHFNDPDMLQVGNVGLSVAEQKSHFALWCVVGAPLMMGTDVIHASQQTIEILTTKGLIEVNQDLGFNGAIQGIMLKNASTQDYSIWMKKLSDGKSLAVVAVNEAMNPVNATVTWQNLGFDASTKFQVSDLWTGKSLGTFTDHMTQQLDSHDNFARKLTVMS